MAPNIRTTESKGFIRVFDGPGIDYTTNHVGSAWTCDDADPSWHISTHRHLRSREDALRVLELVSQLTAQEPTP